MRTKRMTPVQPLKRVEDIKKISCYLYEHNQTAYILWQIGINTGLRISDIIRLNVKDVRNREYITVIEQKTQKPKKFPIVDRLKKLLSSYTKGMPDDEPLLLCKHGSRYNRKEAYRNITGAAAAVGIEEHVGTHTMRKTFGYHHYQQFHDPVILQKIFNHSSLRITLIYIGVEQDEIDESYKSFSYDYKPLAPVDTSRYRGPQRQKTQKLTGGEKHIIQFLKNYLENGGQRHRDFAELALCQVKGAI